MNISHSKQFLFIQLLLPPLPSTYPRPFCGMIIIPESRPATADWKQGVKGSFWTHTCFRFVILKTKSCRDSLGSFLVAPKGTLLLNRGEEPSLPEHLKVLMSNPSHSLEPLFLNPATIPRGLEHIITRHSLHTDRHKQTFSPFRYVYICRHIL